MFFSNIYFVGCELIHVLDYEMWEDELMETKPQLWSENFKVTSLLVNPMGRLGLFGVLNLLQETAWIHAENLGFGIASMEKESLYWVVTRLTLQMNHWPRYGEQISIQTWIRAPEGAFVTREFRILDEQGKTLGICSSTFMALDKNSKRPLPMQDMRDWESYTLTQSTGLVPEKIPVQGEYETAGIYHVRNSDLDINQHVNNTKYAQWIMDAIPYEYHKSLRLKTYAVNFLAETYLGDQVQIDRSCQSTDVTKVDHGVSVYRGIRTSDERILFTALMEWERRK